MPLHLLGKKSWNVYNTDNVEKVRRDEADAKAREEAAEQRMQEEDAARRVAILRGEEPPLPSDSASAGEHHQSGSRKDGLSQRKRRRLRGEDDTDREIRHAREDAETGDKAKQALVKKDDQADAPLLDHAGHLQLIPAPDEKTIRKAEKNAEVEAEKAKKRKREEDQYTMRFSNATGFKNNMDSKPWYAASSKPAGQDPESSYNAMALSSVQDKDVWGNEDPLRRERERSRISTNDPFAAMQQAQRQLKQSARDRDTWNSERQKELDELKRAEDRRRKHERRHHHRRRGAEDEDSLDGFSLDAPNARKRDRGEKDGRRRHRHRHHHQSRSRSRNRNRHADSRHSSRD